MDARPLPPVRWSEHWTAMAHGAELIVSAGADEAVVIDGIGPTTIEAVLGWVHDAVRPADDEQRRVLDRLVELGAVVATTPEPGHVEIVVDPTGRGVGDELGHAIQQADPNVGGVVVVRTSAGWPPGPMDRVHLGVDVTNAHHLVLGPVVMPGVSTCLECVQLRAERQWGRPVVAARPGVTRSLAVVAELVAIQLRLVAAGHSPLVNATIAWNLADGSVDRQSVYKRPRCPSCDVATVGPIAWPAGPGRSTAPW